MTPRPAFTTALVALALVLTGCSTGGSLPSGSSSGVPGASSGVDPSVTPSDGAGPTASPDASPGASPGASPAAEIPTDCRDLVPAADYEAVFGTTPLNHPDWIDPEEAGAVEPKTSEPGATDAEVLTDATMLRCAWRDPAADITGLIVEIARADPALAERFLDERESESGFTCTAVHDGRRCQRVEPNEQYPVEQATTLFVRDDIYVSVFQANFPTDDLLGSIVDAIWT